MLDELRKSLLSALSLELMNENVFRKNYQKLTVQLLFICAVCSDDHTSLRDFK